MQMCACHASSRGWGVEENVAARFTLSHRGGLSKSSSEAPDMPSNKSAQSSRKVFVLFFFFFSGEEICCIPTDLLIQVLRFNLGNGMRVSLSTVGEGVSRQTLQGERDYPLCSSISISQDTLGELWYTFGPSSLIPFS